jgi:hypothetical protein
MAASHSSNSSSSTTAAARAVLVCVSSDHLAVITELQYASTHTLRAHGVRALVFEVLLVCTVQWQSKRR